MSSSDPSYQQLGLDAISTCFIPSSSMMLCSSEAAPFFHPSIVPHDASFVSGSGVGADVAAHYNYMANDAMETDEDAYAGAESCSTVHSMPMLPAAGDGPLGFFQYGGPADVTIAQPSRMAKLITGEPHCSWLYDGPSAVSIHEPYYLRPFPGAGSFPAANGLSLRLGAAQSSSVTMASLPAEQSSEVSCSGLTHANSEGFGYQQQQPPTTVKARASDDGMPMPMPFQLPPYPEMHSTPPQFSQVLPRSRYANIAQELLNGFAACLLNDVAEKIADGSSVSGGIGSDLRTPSSVSSSNLLMLPSNEQRQDDVAWMEAQKLRSDLLRLLQLMDQRCNRCFDDIQATASRFSSMVAHSGGVGGGGAIVAAPRFAHRAVWAAYQRLRKRITGMMVVAVAQREQPSSLADKERRWESSFIQKHWALQQLRRGDQQSWRPQRGLPEKSVAVLKAWMFENFLRPYPKDNEKDMLAARSGLSRSQVSNWFINARVRLWKPMIEEMYEELKRSSGGREVEHLGSKDVVC